MASRARARNHIRVAGRVLVENVDVVTVRSSVGEEKVSWSSIAMVYPAAPGTSVQSKTMFWPTEKRASTDGDSSDGAASVLEEGGLTVRVAVRETPAAVAVTVTEVCVLTVLVDAAKLALAWPPGTVTLVGTETAPLELVRLTAVPAEGAGAVRVTVPVEDAPPITLVGERASEESTAVVPVAACGVKLRVEENGPKAPAEFRARTRHHICRAGSPLRTACDAVTVGLATYGADMVEVSSTLTS